MDSNVKFFSSLRFQDSVKCFYCSPGPTVLLSDGNLSLLHWHVSHVCPLFDLTLTVVHTPGLFNVLRSVPFTVCHHPEDSGSVFHLRRFGFFLPRLFILGASSWVNSFCGLLQTLSANLSAFFPTFLAAAAYQTLAVSLSLSAQINLCTNTGQTEPRLRLQSISLTQLFGYFSFWGGLGSSCAYISLSSPCLTIELFSPPWKGKNSTSIYNSLVPPSLTSPSFGALNLTSHSAICESVSETSAWMLKYHSPPASWVSLSLSCWKCSLFATLALFAHCRRFHTLDTFVQHVPSQQDQQGKRKINKPRRVGGRRAQFIARDDEERMSETTWRRAGRWDSQDVWLELVVSALHNCVCVVSQVPVVLQGQDDVGGEKEDQLSERTW